MPPPCRWARAPSTASIASRAIELSGTFEPWHQFLLDNRSHAGQPGYEVLTPFLTADGRRMLVNRGWVPFGGYRDRLPDVSHGDGTSR